MTALEDSRMTNMFSVGGHPARFAGLAFLVLFSAVFVLMVIGPDVFEGTIEEYAADHADSARVDRLSILVIVVAPLAGAALVVTAAYLRSQLERAVGSATMATYLTTLGAGISAIGLTIAATAAGAAAHVATGPSSGGFPADASAGYSLDLFAVLALTSTVWGISVLMVSVAVATLRTRQLPRWMSWVALVAGPLLPISWILGSVPLLIGVLWLPAASLMMKNDAPMAVD